MDVTHGEPWVRKGRRLEEWTEDSEEDHGRKEERAKEARHSMGDMCATQEYSYTLHRERAVFA